jgi:MFS family permease
MLIIWLQGIWLPQHGYSFNQTPLWAGISMVPLTLGFLVMGPISGILSDRLGARGLATGGLVLSGATFLLLELLPMNFTYIWFALLIFLFAVGMGLFFSPNQASVMNSLPPDQRGAGAGMLSTFQNSATVLSMGLFFTIVTLGLAADLPTHLFHGLTAAGVPSGPGPPGGQRTPNREPVLGLPRVQPSEGTARSHRCPAHLSASQAAYVTGRSFFPKLIEATVLARPAPGVRLRRRRDANSRYIQRPAWQALFPQGRQRWPPSWPKVPPTAQRPPGLSKTRPLGRQPGETRRRRDNRAACSTSAPRPRSWVSRSAPFVTTSSLGSSPRVGGQLVGCAATQRRTSPGCPVSASCSLS